MIIIGIIIVLVIFLGVGWAVSTEMFQHRAWRRRVESGDVDIVAALIEEALAGWRKRPATARCPRQRSGQASRAPNSSPSTIDGATVSTSAEGEFRTEDGGARPGRFGAR